MRNLRHAPTIFMGAVSGMLIGSHPASATTSVKLTMEAIDDYSDMPGFPNVDCVEEAEGFYGPMSGLEGPTPWSSGSFFFNNGVEDTDFYDPDLTLNTIDHDTTHFDQPGTAIAWFLGHGECNDATNPIGSSPGSAGEATVV
jgi:hypothetical protein